MTLRPSFKEAGRHRVPAGAIVLAEAADALAIDVAVVTVVDVAEAERGSALGLRGREHDLTAVPDDAVQVEALALPDLGRLERGPAAVVVAGSAILGSSLALKSRFGCQALTRFSTTAFLSLA